MTAYFDERRKSGRINARLEAQYTGINPSPEISGGALSYDISITGARLKCTDFIPLNTKLRINITLGPSAPVVASACVRWVVKEPYNEQYQLGIEFEGIDEKYKNDLSEYITSYPLAHANPRAYSAYKT